MEQPTISDTPTVRGIVRDLASEGPIPASRVVQEILKRHTEYASGAAREMAHAAFPKFKQQKPADAWIADVRAMFDPLLARELHGRLVILALCRLDPELGDFLRSFGAQIERELTEDFDSLLLPDYAGEHAYRRRFLKILQNQAKTRPEPDSDYPSRQGGFLILAHQGRRLEELIRLCFQQQYNTCFTAHYQLPAGSSWADFQGLLVTDLKGIVKGNFGTVGDFLPELGVNLRPGTAQRSWQQVVAESNDTTSSAKGVPVVPASLPRLLDHWSSAGLSTGQRVVLFVEWRGVAAEAMPESLGLNDDVVDLLSAPPERVGIVLSGLPDGVRQRFKGPQVYELGLPKEEPPRVSQTLLNDTPAGPDRLKIVDEVQAIADAIALKKMHPPLVVGVFGGWGTGKSFVLHLIEDRLQELRCEAVGANAAARSAYPFIGHPYLIRFDAWTYAKSNLWASLMQTTLVELDRQLSLEHELAALGIDPRESSEIWRLLQGLTDIQRERLRKDDFGREAIKKAEAFARQGSPGRLWDELERLRQDENVHLEIEEERLRDLRADKMAAQRTLEAEIDDELAGESRRVAWAPIRDEFGEAASKRLDNDKAPTFDTVVASLSIFRKIGHGLKNFSLPAAAFMVMAVISGVVIAKLEPLFDWWAQAAGAVIAMTAPLVRAWEWIEQRRSAYEQRLAAAQAHFQQLRAARIEERLQVAKEGSAAEKVVAIAAKVEDAETRVERIRSRLGVTGHSRSLNDFLKTRIQEGLYRRELGMLDQIQSDIQELSDTLVRSRARGTEHEEKLAELFPRGEPRVVLLIDDLDRCPPDKVVEVLEAAQLLVKTRLFVVVIAMDVRYVTRALEAMYKDVLVRSGEPSGLDYIEKIIQIPYRVRNVSPPAIKSFLRSQMEIQEAEDSQQPEVPAPELDEEAHGEVDTADEQAKKARLSASARAAQTESTELPSQVIQFQPNEYAAISAACSALAVSPRTMKRLVNVFKLLKIIWYRHGLESGPSIDVKQAMLAILALCARHPEVLRKLLADMEGAYRAETSPGQKPLVEFLVKRCQEGAAVALYPPDWHRVAEALQRPAFFPPDLTFGRLEEANLHLLNSFSFVGETDAEREATLQRGYYRNSGPAAVDPIRKAAARDAATSSDDPAEPNAPPPKSTAVDDAEQAGQGPDNAGTD